MDKDDLIAAIKAHSERTGLAPATITSRAVRNSRLFARLEAGGDCTTDVVKRITAWIAADAEPDRKAG